MVVQLILGTMVSLVSAADLTVLNDALAPAGIKLSKDGAVDKGDRREQRTGDGRTLYFDKINPDPHAKITDYYNADFWSAEVNRGKDGSLDSVIARRYEKGGHPTDEFKANLQHGSIVSITTCRHPGQKSCVTATPHSCERVKQVLGSLGQIDKQRDQCGKTFKLLGSIYDSTTIAAARTDIGESTAYATSPLSGIDTALDAVENLNTTCEKYGKVLTNSRAAGGAAPANSSK